MEKLISKNSSLYWMGIATIAILFFHIGQNPSNHIIHKCINFVFSKGSLGVNIFFFLSGYGLSHSLSKNSLNDFYFHRFQRLYPMMLIFMGASYIFHGGFSSYFLIDIFKHATGISFFAGDAFPDWFIPCLSMVYILFPFIFYITRWLNNKNIVFILIILVLPVLAIIPLKDFNYTLFLPRIPMVLLGVMTYLAEQEKSKERFYLILLCCALLNYTQLYSRAHFVIPLIILFFSKYNICPFSRIISFLGKHSLEIYLSQCLFVFSFDLSKGNYVLTLILLLLVMAITSACLYYTHSFVWDLVQKRKETK